jgi:hypothetical protein
LKRINRHRVDGDQRKDWRPFYSKWVRSKTKKGNEGRKQRKEKICEIFIKKVEENQSEATVKGGGEYRTSAESLMSQASVWPGVVAAAEVMSTNNDSRGE